MLILHRSLINKRITILVFDEYSSDLKMVVNACIELSSVDSKSSRLYEIALGLIISSIRNHSFKVEPHDFPHLIFNITVPL